MELGTCYTWANPQIENMKVLPTSCMVWFSRVWRFTRWMIPGPALKPTGHHANKRMAQPRRLEPG